MHLFDVDVPRGPMLMESRTTAPGDKVQRAACLAAGAAGALAAKLAALAACGATARGMVHRAASHWLVHAHSYCAHSPPAFFRTHTYLPAAPDVQDARGYAGFDGVLRSEVPRDVVGASPGGAPLHACVRMGVQPWARLASRSAGQMRPSALPRPASGFRGQWPGPACVRARVYRQSLVWDHGAEVVAVPSAFTKITGVARRSAPAQLPSASAPCLHASCALCLMRAHTLARLRRSSALGAAVPGARGGVPGICGGSGAGRGAQRGPRELWSLAGRGPLGQGCGKAGRPPGHRCGCRRAGCACGLRRGRGVCLDAMKGCLLQLTRVALHPCVQAWLLLTSNWSTCVACDARCRSSVTGNRDTAPTFASPEPQLQGRLPMHTPPKSRVHCL